VSEDIPDEVPPPAPPVHLTPAELALRWRVSVRSLERMRQASMGPDWTAIGGSIRYRFDDVLNYEQRQRCGRAR
jgi:hypothetical protein